MNNIKSEPMFLLKSYSVHVTVLFIFLFLYSGCANVSIKPLQMQYAQGINEAGWPDGQCEERFRQYWSNRFAGNIDSGYDMESPHFREVVIFDKYKNYVRHAVKNKLVSMEIHQIQKESDFMITIDCLAKIQIGDGRIVDVSMMDRWVLTSGKWYHLIKDPLIFSL